MKKVRGGGPAFARVPADFFCSLFASGVMKEGARGETPEPLASVVEYAHACGTASVAFVEVPALDAEGFLELSYQRLE